MESHVVKIIKTEYVTHDVKRFRIEKPDEYKYIPGQATEVTIEGMKKRSGKDRLHLLH